MDTKTMTALEGSIKKWEGIVNGTHQNMGSLDCPLCRQFYDEDIFGEIVCTGCPVAEKVKTHCCRGTPYLEAASVLRNGFAVTPETREAAKKELEFLKSLRED